MCVLVALENPELALSELTGLVVLDEAQRQPALFAALRPLVDRPGARARSVLLGSASPTLVRGVSESLAGRAHFIEMGGFGLGEGGREEPVAVVGSRRPSPLVPGGERRAKLRVRGKGRKQRGLTLWKEVAEAVRAWLAMRGDALVPEVFLNARGGPISRWGCRYVLDKHVEAATTKCPSIANRRISPHVLRHTCAMTLLQATGDIRKVSLWLGHASQQTTEIYLAADPTEKMEALDAVKLPSLRKGTFSPPEQFLASLMGAAPAPVPPSPRSRRKSTTSRSPDPMK